MRRVDFDELATRSIAIIDVDVELATWAEVQPGRPGVPQDHLVAIREVAKDLFPRRRDSHLADDGFRRRRLLLHAFRAGRRGCAAVSAALLTCSRLSSPNVSSIARRSVIACGSARYRRCVPRRRSVISPARLSTVRCFEMAGRVTGKWLAMSVAGNS